MRKIMSVIVSLAIALSVTCGLTTTSANAEDSAAEAALPTIDNTKWQYNSEDDVYYQLGIQYCENPADISYETLAVFVPGGYMDAEDNGDGTYTCKIDETSEVGTYTATTAPIVMPINTPGYSAMAPLTSYSSFTEYTDEGFVYVHAGCRGRDAGAPAGVTDLKAAVRYLRYTDDSVPGDAESIFTFGMSGGGAQSALMGATGDSALYDTYLEEIGAVSGVSDAVLGSMCWCPITNLDTADEAYEWMMGVTRSGLSEEEQKISDMLAKAFAEYINNAGIKDSDGNILTLSESEDGMYQAGSYYDYMLSVIEGSLNNFLSDTVFPYEVSSGGHGGPGGHGGFGGGFPGGGERPGNGNGQTPDGALPEGDAPSDLSFEEIDDITRNETSTGISLSGTYNTAQDYIDALNSNGVWVNYDASTNTASITSIKDFVLACKRASKNLGAYLAAILEELGSDYAADYAADLSKRDSEGNTVDSRLDMYTPLYYLLESSDGYETSKVAKYWRIRTGIAQGDCALSTEVNLALALEDYEAVESVDFETVWGAGHTMAERTGNSTENFISWVNKCMAV